MFTGLLTEHKHARLTELNNKFYDIRNNRIINSNIFKKRDNLKTVDTSLHNRVGETLMYQDYISSIKITKV